MVEAGDSLTPLTYDLSQVFTDSLLAEGSTYVDQKELILLGLFDGKFAILACYTNEYDTVIAIYDIINSQLKFHTTIKQYIVSCTIVPYCPTPYDVFFNMQFINMNDIVSLDFFYFSYAARDNYCTIFRRLSTYTNEKDDSSISNSILVKSCL